MIKLRTEVRSTGRIYSQGIAASGKPRSEVAALRSRCPNTIRTQLTKYDSAKPMSDAIRRNEKKRWLQMGQGEVMIGHSMESTRVL